MSGVKSARMKLQKTTKVQEYNLQLSNRRAASVKRYLTDLGIGDGALETVGYGENKPAVQGSNEAAWAANRRVELIKR